MQRCRRRFPMPDSRQRQPLSDKEARVKDAQGDHSGAWPHGWLPAQERLTGPARTKGRPKRLILWKFRRFCHMMKLINMKRVTGQASACNK